MIRALLLGVFVLTSVFPLSFSTATDESLTEKSEKQREEIRKDVKNMEDRLAKIGRDLDELQTEAKKMSGRVKKQMDADIKRLEKKREEVTKDLEQASKASGRAWDKMKSGLEKAFAELKKGFENARQEIRKNEDEKSE